MAAIRRSLLVGAVLAGGLALFSGPATASSIDIPMLPHGHAGNYQWYGPQNQDAEFAPLLHGTTHCLSGTPGTNSGVVVVLTSKLQNDTKVHVTLLNGTPNSTYYVAIACVENIGSLTTNDQGNGVANIDTPGVTTGSFFVDMGIGAGYGPAGDYHIAGPFTGG